MPPAGCECEYKDIGTGEWIPVEIKYSSSQIVVFSGRISFRDCSVELSKDVVIDKPKFRPIRSEADKKRDEAIDEITRVMGVFAVKEVGKDIYDAIAAGKIPHIRID
ncbi:hypothetical protein ACUADT_001097 [Enterobacter cloacae]